MRIGYVLPSNEFLARWLLKEKEQKDRSMCSYFFLKELTLN